MTGLATSKKWHKVAPEAALWYNMSIKYMCALAVLEHSRADDKKGTLVMSSSISRPKKPALERFLSFVTVQDDGCWLWTGSKNKDGYGGFINEIGAWQSAHRWSYEYFVGSIPQRQDLDHLCRNRACVHPEHLEPVSHRENNSRGAQGILKSQKTSQYIGVYWVKKRNKWSAQIQINGETHFLGYFDGEEQAHQAHTQAYNAYETNGTIPISRLAAKKTSRYPGVAWHKHQQKWIVQARVDGKQRCIGYFVDEDEAYQAYLKATGKGSDEHG